MVEKLTFETMLIYDTSNFHTCKNLKRTTWSILNCYAYFTKTFVHPNATKHITTYQAKGLK